jgi:TrmH family RNA methyltransferase
VLTRAEERLLHGLQRRKARETQGFFLAEGIRVVEELVRSGIDLELAVTATALEDNPRGRALKQALSARVRVKEIGDRELRAHAATDQPQGVLVVARVPLMDLQSIVPGSRSVVLIADAVQDPGNLGTLIRVADAFAATALITLTGTVDVWNPKVVRSSAGSCFHLPVLASSTLAVREWTERHGFQVLGADTNGIAIEEVGAGSRVALVVGNEGAGLQSDTRALVGQTVSIRMPGRAESLNVAVAAGILMYLLTR